MQLIKRITHRIRDTLRTLVLMAVAFATGYDGAEFVEDEAK